MQTTRIDLQEAQEEKQQLEQQNQEIQARIAFLEKELEE